MKVIVVLFCQLFDALLYVKPGRCNSAIDPTMLNGGQTKKFLLPDLHFTWYGILQNATVTAQTLATTLQHSHKMTIPGRHGLLTTTTIYNAITPLIWILWQLWKMTVTQISFRPASGVLPQVPPPHTSTIPSLILPPSRIVLFLLLLALVGFEQRTCQMLTA